MLVNMNGIEMLCTFRGKMVPPSFTLKIEAEVSPEPNYMVSNSRVLGSPTANTKFLTLPEVFV
jgi:hypothetical protein